MCNNVIHTDNHLEYQKNNIDILEEKISRLEVEAIKIKAVNFVNLQTFDEVYNGYDVGEIYVVKGVGYSIITKKTTSRVDFIVIARPNTVWAKHWQDVDKHLIVKQGVYLDLFTGREYRNKIKVPAFKPSHFKAIGDEDLILKGCIFKD